MPNPTNIPRWLSTGYLTSKPEGPIDHEKGTIEGISVTTEGEAKGHRVWLDESFVDEVVKQGNEKKNGLKARFGHPNMCSTSLGTFLGRITNFRKETTVRDNGQKAYRAVADLSLSDSAKESPNGDLYAYVLGLADKEADMFGTSIVFTPGKSYRKTQSGRKVTRQYQTSDDGSILYDENGQPEFLGWVDENGKAVDTAADPVVERDYASCEKLRACDVVDDPAANDGLFSQFGQETVAGQITEFLDLHPQVWDAVEKNPEILEAISQHGEKVAEFIARYNLYKTGEEIDEALLSSFQSRESDLADQLAVAHESLEVLQGQLDTAESDLQAATDHGSDLQAQFDLVETQLTEANDRVESLTVELATATARADKAEATVQRLAGNLALGNDSDGDEPQTFKAAIELIKSENPRLSHDKAWAKAKAEYPELHEIAKG